MIKKLAFYVILMALQISYSCSLKEPLDYCEGDFEPAFDVMMDNSVAPAKISLINKSKNLSHSATFTWYLDSAPISTAKDTVLTLTKAGSFKIKLVVTNCSKVIKSSEQDINIDSRKFIKSLPYSSNDIGTKIKATRDGNFIACGIIDSMGNNLHMWIGKLNREGEVIWPKPLPEFGIGEARDIIETKRGTYVVCGTASKMVNGVLQDKNIIVAEYSANGNKLWGKIEGYGGTGDDWGFAIKETMDGGFIVAGCSNGTPTASSLGGGDMYLLKLNSNGDKVWDKSFGGLYFDCAYSIHQLSDASYILCGSRQMNSNGNSDGYVVKTDQFGGSLWERSYPDNSGNEVFHSIKATQDGNFVLAGFRSSQSTGKDIYVLKMDNIGTKMSFAQGIFSGTNDDEAFDVVQTSDEGFAIIGYTESEGQGRPGNPDVYLVKTDKNGVVLWKEFYDENNKFQKGASLVETPDCGLMLFGTTKNIDKDFLIIKTDKMGKYK